MSGEVVNLRRARKARERAASGNIAAANRARFGRTKGERQAATLEAERLAATIAGAKREGPDGLA